MTYLLAETEETELMTSAFFPVLDIIVLILGIYVFYTSRKMIQENLPPRWLMQPDEFRKIRDPENFCREMYPKTVALSIICILYGVVSLINSYLFESILIQWIEILALIAILVWYIVIYRRASSKFSK